MAGVTLAGSNQALSTSLPVIYSEFLLLRDYTGVIRSTATSMTLKPHEGTTKNIINYGRVQAFNLTDGVDINQAQTLSDSKTSLTPAEVGVQAILGGRTMARIQDPDLLARTGRILNNAYDLKEDQDGAVQFQSFAALGATGQVISPGHLAAANGRLSVGNAFSSSSGPEPAPGPWYAVIHPLSAVALAGRLTPFATTPAGGTAYGAAGGAHAGTSVTVGVDTGGLGASIIREGISALGMVSGTTVKQDANIPLASTGVDATSAAYSKEGLIYVSEIDPQLDPDTSDKSMRGAVELNLWGSYVWGLYRPTQYGVGLTFDASMPTS